MAREDKDRLIADLTAKVSELNEYAEQMKAERDKAQREVQSMNERMADLESEIIGRMRINEEEEESEIDFDSIFGGGLW